MLDAVSFGKRHHRNYRKDYNKDFAPRKENNNLTEKLLSAGVGAASLVGAKKISHKPTIEDVVLKMNKMNNAKQYRKVGMLQKVVNAMAKKEGSELSQEIVDKLNEAKITAPQLKAGATLDDVKGVLKTTRDAVRANDQRAINSDIKLLKKIAKLQGKLDAIPEAKKEGKYAKSLGRLINHYTKKAAKLFGEEFEASQAKDKIETLNTASKTLSDNLVALKTRIAGEYANVRLLDKSSDVKKAYNALLNNKRLAIGALLGAAAVGVFNALSGKKNSDGESGSNYNRFI